MILRKSSKLIGQGQLEEALATLEFAREYFEKRSDKETLGSIYYDYTTIYYSQSDYDASLEYNNKSIDLLKSYDNKTSDEWKDDLAKLYHLRSAILIESGFSNQAKPYLIDAVDIVVSPRIKAPLLPFFDYIYIH